MKIWLVCEDTYWGITKKAFKEKENAFNYLRKLWREEVSSNEIYYPCLNEDFNGDYDAMIQSFIDTNEQETIWYEEIELE